ncbi:MAG: ChaN family lipoprotein [Burkholderiaceae bacterium]
MRIPALLTVCAVFLLSACQTPRPVVPDPVGSAVEPVLPADIGRLPAHPVWLIGEQHDAPEHQAMQDAVVRFLTGRHRLAALVIEMAEAGQSTAGLSADAGEAQVRQVLGWTDERNDAGWPWDRYGPTILSAVRAGVPVLGGNLPRDRQRQAMADDSLDRLLDAASLARQQALVREGHCMLLPDRQIAPMTRIQLARDRSMAGVVLQAIRPGKTVLLIAGNEHVRRDLGVPRHLPADVPVLVLQSRGRDAAAPGVSGAGADEAHGLADLTWLTPPRPPRDYCAELRQQMKR